MTSALTGEDLCTGTGEKCDVLTAAGAGTAYVAGGHSAELDYTGPELAHSAELDYNGSHEMV